MAYTSCTRNTKAHVCRTCSRPLPIDCFKYHKNTKGYSYYEIWACKRCQSLTEMERKRRPDVKARNAARRKELYWEKKRVEQAKLNSKRSYIKRKKLRMFKKDALFVECRSCKKILPRDSYYRKNDWQCPQCCCAETQSYHARKRIEDPEWYKRSVAKLLQWKKDNPERVYLQQRILKNRRLKRMLENGTHDFTHEQWLSLIDFWDYTCAYCDKRGGNLERDHVVPLAKGGEHTLSNIVPSCPSCNRKKETLDMRTWLNDEQRYEATLTTMGDTEYEIYAKENM